jgi:hypothetical protein
VVRGGKVRCPDCGAIVARLDQDDDERPLRAGSAPSIPIVPILVGAALGLLGLALLGGALATLWLTSSSGPAVAEGDVPGLPIVNPEDGPGPAAPPLLEPIRPAPGQGGGPGAGTLPLQELKAATVYIKNTTVNVGHATGSGFVVRAQGDTVWVVTNHHVIAPLDPNEVPGRRAPSRPRGPLRPSAVELTAVFRSGTPEEQSVRAALVADDAKNDLAVLRVGGARNAPRPIDCKRTPKLVETMTIWAFGFPFGAALDPRKANPAITVTKGTVSSLRLDARGELSVVQIDGDLNPGNSGGPIVDETGALVGVAVAKVEDTRIGFAVPVKVLNQLLDGRVN